MVEPNNGVSKRSFWQEYIAGPFSAFADDVRDGASRLLGSRDAVASADEAPLRVFRDRFTLMAAADLADGQDDINEPAALAEREAFLQDIKKRNPSTYGTFILQIEAILKKRPPLRNDADVRSELFFLNLHNILRTVQNRSRFTSPEGVVRFPTAAEEKRFALADLTPDEEISFEARNPKTLATMGITAHGAFTCFRVHEKTIVRLNQKIVEVPPGTFVVKTAEGTLYKVVVLNGDLIIDSLNAAFLTPGAGVPQAPAEFEQFLSVKMPDLSLDVGRRIFHENYSSYKKLLLTDYRELLDPRGIPMDKHFVYFVQWSGENNLPPSESSMRTFLDLIVKQKNASGGAAGGAGGQGPAADDQAVEGSGKKAGLIEKAMGALFGRRDEDEDRLSYRDQRVKDASEKTDIVRKRHGPLFAIVRLQGDFFDLHTYNRLSGNYTARTSAMAVEDREYLLIQELFSGHLPSDIQARAKASSFAQRLRATASYDRSSDAELRRDLAFSEAFFSGQQSKPEDFAVQYGPDGSVAGVAHRGKPYERDRFISPPDRLRHIPNDAAAADIGGVHMTLGLQDYFSHYHALEKARENESQNLLLYNAKEQRVERLRNPMWFVEDGKQPLYQDIARAVTSGAVDPDAKLLALGSWIQKYFDYQEEAREINKLTMATLMDRGGDCEDGYTSFRTLANAAGLGNRVGAVIFEGHIAPLIMGNHGGTVYRIGGNPWTIYELATPVGQTVRPGVTKHKSPRLFVLPDGTMVGASDSWVPLRIVPIGQIDGALLQKFQNAVKAAETFLGDKNNQPSQENLANAARIAGQLGELNSAVFAAYGEIGNSGKMADAIADQLMALQRKAQQFAEGWSRLAEEGADKARRLELAQAPEQFREAIKRYLELDEILVENLAPTAKKIYEVIHRYIGKEGDLQAMIALNDELVGLINASRIYTSIQEMQVIYDETLKHLPSALRGKIRKDLDQKIAIVDKLLAPLNATRSNIHRLEGE